MRQGTNITQLLVSSFASLFRFPFLRFASRADSVAMRICLLNVSFFSYAR